MTTKTTQHNNSNKHNKSNILQPFFAQQRQHNTTIPTNTTFPTTATYVVFVNFAKTQANSVIHSLQIPYYTHVSKREVECNTHPVNGVIPQKKKHGMLEMKPLLL
jgi:hypothetical protein